MIALKKVYGDELLRLALVLSLLKTDPSDYLQQEALLLSPGLHTANGSDWSFQHEPQTLIRPPYIHPKSLDHALMDYERWLFEELNSLGRYYDAYGHRVTRDGDERMSNLNGGRPDTILHTYLVNNVATDTVAPTLLESVAPPEPPRHDSLDERPDPHDGVSDDANVAHEVKVSQDESEDESEPTLEPRGPSPDAVVTLSPGFLHNCSDTDLFADIQSRSFDVSEFLVTPSAMHIKQELADEAETSRHRADDEAPLVKTEPKPEPLYGDDAMDDFVPYFAQKSESAEDDLYDPFMESVYHQNAADLQDYEETLETLTKFKSHLEYLDVKQQQEDLEQYLLENTPLDCDEVYDLAPMFEEELVLEVKRERASTSFTSEASSSGVSEMDNWEVCSDEAVGATETVVCSGERVKHEPSSSGDELTQEDMDLIEVLWKQDVDMGFSLDDPLSTPPPAGPTATKVEMAGHGGAPLDSAELLLKASERDDIEKVKASLLEPVETKPDDPWAGLSYTVDTETGEYVLQGELPSELVSSEESRFDLLEEALQLVELDDGTVAGTQHDPPVADVVHVAEQGGADVKAAGEVSETGEPKKEEEVDSMLHPGMSRHAPSHHPHHPHHPLAAYHHQSIMRQMSVEQRWQDLASLLSVPPPGDQQYHPHHQPPHHHPHHYHHAHNIGSGGYAHAHAHNAHYAAAALAPPPPPADKHDNYGATAGLDGGYKVEGHPHQHDAIYYQHPQGPVAAAGAGGAGGAAGGGGVPADMTGGSDGLLQAILNDDDLQLMDMAMNEGMYTMRMLDGGVVPHAHPHPAAATATAHMMMSHERESLSDSAVSSMGSERVPSLSDGEWCDGGSDSAQDFHGSKFRPYEGGMCRGGAGGGGAVGGAGGGGAAGAGERAPPQKKHHMFGKRCFQDPPASSADAAVVGAGGEPRAPLIKYEYPEQACAPYAHPHDRAVPLSSEYAARGASASLATQHAQLAPLTQPALHLHSLASPPHIISGGGVSEMARYGYATATPERVRHNHTYSAPHGAPDSRPNVRDKRVRRLTDGSISDSGSCGTAAGHISRDEKRAKALGIPMSVQDIINLPMDEFNERLSKHDLSEAQLSLIRDIRRRGKNKVAAQNCRKRKLDQITSLADEVRTVRDRKQRLQRDHQHLMAERQRVKDRFAALYRHVFQNLRDAEGRPVSSAQYSLQQAADGNVVLVPKMHPSDQHMNRSSDDEMDRKKHYEQ